MRRPLLFAAAMTFAAIAAPAAAQRPTGTLIVLNKAEATASLLDAATGRVVATVPVGTGPHEATVSPDGSRAVVSNYGDRTPGSSLTVIDVREGKAVSTISFVPYRRPHGIVWIPGTSKVAVSAEMDSAAIVVDVDKGAVVTRIPSGQSATHMVVIAPDGRRAYTANIGSGSITAMDLVAGRSLGVVTTGAGAEGIDVTPDGREVWVANRAVNTVSVVDAATLAVVATLPSAASPIRVKFTPDGRHALVSNAQSSDVRIFDVAARKEITTIPMPADTGATRETILGSQFAGPTPVGILITPDGKFAFVANTRTERIVVLDLTPNVVVDQYRAGREPDGMAWTAVVPRAGR